MDEDEDDEEEEEEREEVSDDVLREGQHVEVRFVDGWYRGVLQQATETTIRVLYEDPLDPGPHTHQLIGNNAVSWRRVPEESVRLSEVWFKKVMPMIDQVRKASLAMVRSYL